MLVWLLIPNTKDTDLTHMIGNSQILTFGIRYIFTFCFPAAMIFFVPCNVTLMACLDCLRIIDDLGKKPMGYHQLFHESCPEEKINFPTSSEKIFYHGHSGHWFPPNLRILPTFEYIRPPS